MNPKEFFEAEKDAIEALAAFNVKNLSLEEIAKVFPHLPLDNCSPDDTVYKMMVDNLQAEMKRERCRERAKEEDKDENVRAERHVADLTEAITKTASSLNIAEVESFQDVLWKYKDSTNHSFETMGKLLVDAFGEERGCELLREMIHHGVPNEKRNKLLEIKTKGNNSIEIKMKGNDSIGHSTYTKAQNTSTETIDPSTTKIVLDAFDKLMSNKSKAKIFREKIVREMVSKIQAENTSSPCSMKTLNKVLIDTFGLERTCELYRVLDNHDVPPETFCKVIVDSLETKPDFENGILFDQLTVTKHKEIFRDMMSQMKAANIGLEAENAIICDFWAENNIPKDKAFDIFLDALGPDRTHKIYREVMKQNKESPEPKGNIVFPVDKESIKEVENVSSKEIRKLLQENFVVAAKSKNGTMENMHSISSFSSQPQTSMSSSLSRNDQQQKIPVRFTCRRYVHHKSRMMWTICFDYFGVDTTRNKTMIIQKPRTNVSLRNEVELVWLRVERETTNSKNTMVTIIHHESVASAVAFFKDKIASIKSEGYLYKESHRVGVVPRKSWISIDDKNLKPKATSANARATISEAVSTKNGQNAESKTTSVSSVTIEDESDVLAKKILQMPHMTPWMHAKLEANGDYKKFTDEWMDLDKVFFVGGDNQAKIAKIRGFYLRHAKLMGDEQLARYIFSYATSYYLGYGIYKRGEASIDEGVVGVEEYQQRRVKYLIRLGQIIEQVHQVEINSESCVQMLSGEFLFDTILLKKDLSKYHDDSNLEVPKKLAKFFVRDLDLDTNRGLITHLAKLDPTGSMKKIKALNSGLLPKIGTCYACNKTFPRNDLYVCACSTVQYCSKKCQINNWRKHEKECKSFRGLVQQVRNVIPDNTALLELADQGLVNLVNLQNMGYK